MNLRVKEPLGHIVNHAIVTTHYTGDVVSDVSPSKALELIQCGAGELTNDTPTAGAITDDKEPIATLSLE